MAQLFKPFPRPVRGSELRAVLGAEKTGGPFVVYRDEDEELRIVSLANGRPRRTIGRGYSNDVPLPWDSQVSRVHAELERLGECWALIDDGLSTNGTFVNGARIHARRRLADGDSVRVGSSVLLFREPAAPGSVGRPDTERFVSSVAPVQVSSSQRRVLLALCRPFKHADGFPSPATNQQIASELFLSVDRVKSHLRILFEKFGLADLPQNRKRLELVERALASGLISPRDL